MHCNEVVAKCEFELAVASFLLAPSALKFAMLYTMDSISQVNAFGTLAIIDNRLYV